MSDEVADLIDAAADKIEKDGFHQGAYFPGAWISKSRRVPAGVPVCILGAINAVGYSEPVLRRFAIATIGRLVPPSFYSIPAWNDHPGRTQQEVLDLLRKAAKQERM